VVGIGILVILNLKLSWLQKNTRSRLTDPSQGHSHARDPDLQVEEATCEHTWRLRVHPELHKCGSWNMRYNRGPVVL
jgi:hypothetical protein